MNNLIPHILYIIFMSTPPLNAIPTNCTVYSQRVNENNQNSEVTTNCSNLCDPSIHFMNEVYAFDAPAEQISKIEEISKSQTRLDQFQIKPHNLSYFSNWYNCFSLHKSSFQRLNQDFSTMQPQTYYSFIMKDLLNTTYTIYMSAIEKKLFIFSRFNHDKTTK